MDSREKINIFWTGGYDSTFRMCQLIREDIIIQPYYMSDNRKSEKNELEAIRKITGKLEASPEKKAELLPLIFISVEERHASQEITNAYKSLLKKDFMGQQYEWLGFFAKEHPGIELSIHKDDKAIALINKHGALKKEKNAAGDYYTIDEAKSEPELVTLFGNMHFPLADYTKLVMKEEYKKLGFEDVINDTWFCHTPIDGKPCGSCGPCKYTIEEGMPERFTEEALKRYKKATGFLGKMKKKIKGH